MISSKLRIMKHLAKVYDLLALVMAFILSTLILDSGAGAGDFAGFLALKVTLGNGLLFGMLLLACTTFSFSAASMIRSDSHRGSPR